MTASCTQYEPLLSAWVDGMLSPGQHARVAAHLDDCDDCRGTAEDLRRTRFVLRSLPTREVPGGLLDPASLRRRWLATGRPGSGLRGRPPRRRPLVWLPRFSAVAAVLVVLVTTVGYALGGTGGVEPRAELGLPVAVPVEDFVADHLLRTAAVPVNPPLTVRLTGE